jgi:hypothetical protein
MEAPLIYGILGAALFAMLDTSAIRKEWLRLLRWISVMLDTTVNQAPKSQSQKMEVSAVVFAQKVGIAQKELYHPVNAQLGNWCWLKERRIVQNVVPAQEAIIASKQISLFQPENAKLDIIAVTVKLWALPLVK